MVRHQLDERQAESRTPNPNPNPPFSPLPPNNIGIAFVRIRKDKARVQAALPVFAVT